MRRNVKEIGRSSQRTRPTKSKKPLPRVLVIILSALMVALVGLGSYAGVLIYKAKNNPTSLFVPDDNNNLTTLAPDMTAAPVPDAEDYVEVEVGVEATPLPENLRDFRLLWAADGYEYNEDIITVVFMGIDVLAERGPLGFRADTIILGIIDTKTGQVTMLSVPRDTYTLIQKVDADGNIVSHEMNRINAAFAYGQGRNKYSYQNTMEALSYMLGNIPIEYYVGFDMDGMVRIVDSVGGISATVSSDIAAATGLPSGTYRLTGAQALAYVRARKTVGGDPARIKRQQDFVISFLSDIKRHNPVKYIPTLYESLKYYMNTNLTAEQMAVLGLVLKDLDLKNIETMTLPGLSTTINKMSVWEYDETAMQDIVREVYFKKD